MLRGGLSYYRALAIIAIKNERRRQIDEEGWTPKHDDGHGADGGLVRAGECYFRSALGYVERGQLPERWPWDARWWKPKTVERDLVRAGALFDAEVDRLYRNIGTVELDVELPVRGHVRQVIAQLAIVYRHDDEGVPF